MKRGVLNTQVVVLMMVVVLWIVLSFVSETFLSVDNAQNIMRHNRFKFVESKIQQSDISEGFARQFEVRICFYDANPIKKALHLTKTRGPAWVQSQPADNIHDMFYCFS